MENNEERFKIISFEEKFLEDLKTGIRKGWNANHVLQKSYAQVTLNYLIENTFSSPSLKQ